MRPRPRQDQRSTLRTARLGDVRPARRLAALPAAAQAAPPDNDDFADAQIVHVGDRLTGTTLDATAQAGEPAPDPAHTRSVWYHLTPSIAETAADRHVQRQLLRGADDLHRHRPGRPDGGAGHPQLLQHGKPDLHERRGGHDVLRARRRQRPRAGRRDRAQRGSPAGPRQRRLRERPAGRTARADHRLPPSTRRSSPASPSPPVYGGSGHSVWYKLTADDGRRRRGQHVREHERSDRWRSTPATAVGSAHRGRHRGRPHRPPRRRCSSPRCPARPTTSPSAVTVTAPTTSRSASPPRRRRPRLGRPDSAAARADVPDPVRHGSADVQRDALRRRAGLLLADEGLLGHRVVSRDRRPRRPLHGPVERRRR